jgi:hypothetical protein
VKFPTVPGHPDRLIGAGAQCACFATPQRQNAECKLQNAKWPERAEGLIFAFCNLQFELTDLRRRMLSLPNVLIGSLVGNSFP